MKDNGLSSFLRRFRSVEVLIILIGAVLVGGSMLLFNSGVCNKKPCVTFLFIFVIMGSLMMITGSKLLDLRIARRGKEVLNDKTARRSP